MGFMNSVKNFIGIDTDEDYDDDIYDEEESYDEEEAPKKTFARKASHVVPVGREATSRIKIIKPQNFDDSTKVSDEIKARRLVIFDVGQLEEGEARRIVDFVAGSVYGLSGNIRRVSGGIFVAAPSNIDITGENLQTQTRNAFDWNV